MKRFVNLNTCSNYSHMETVVKPEEIIEFVKEDGAQAVALTDINSVGGLHDFYEAKWDRDSLIKGIYGVQIIVTHPEQDSYERKVTLLAKNKTGLKNIYKILSIGYKNHGLGTNEVSLSFGDIDTHRQGILVGIKCTEKDVHSVCQAKEHDERIQELVGQEYAMADYVEIYPYRWYKTEQYAEADVYSVLVDMVKALKKLGKYAVAVNGSNCITPQDEICYNVLHQGTSKKASYFLTTEQMLQEYMLSGLDSHSLAQELVIENPNQIADMIEEFDIDNDHLGMIHIANAKEKLECICEQALHEKYGEHADALIMERYQAELKRILSTEYEVYFVLAHMLSKKSKELGYRTMQRSDAGASFVAYLMGITEVNPLPPHYYCPHCKRVEFVDAKMYSSGLDLNCYGSKQKKCPVCNTPLIGQGNNIYPDFFIDMDDEFVACVWNPFQYEMAPEAQTGIFQYLQDVFGHDQVYYTLDYTSFNPKSMLEQYCDKSLVKVSEKEKRAIINSLIRAKNDSDRISNTIIIFPKDINVLDYSTVGYGLSGHKDIVPIVSWLVSMPCDTLDISYTSILSEIKQLEDLTGIYLDAIPVDEIDIKNCLDFDSFMNNKKVNDDIYYKYDNYLIPKDIEKSIPLNTFSDFVTFYGIQLSMHFDVGNVKEMMGTGIQLEKLILYKEDVMHTLIEYGVNRFKAQDLVDYIGRGGMTNYYLRPQLIKDLRANGVPDDYIRSLRGIRALWSKTYVIAYLMNYLRLLWYKSHCPSEYSQVEKMYDMSESTKNS